MKTMYQRDIEKVGIYILYLPSDIQVQKYLEELIKNISSSFSLILFQNQELYQTQTTILKHSSSM